MHLGLFFSIRGKKKRKKLHARAYVYHGVNSPLGRIGLGFGAPIFSLPLGKEKSSSDADRKPKNERSTE